MDPRLFIEQKIFFFARARTRLYRALLVAASSALFLAVIFPSFAIPSDRQQTAANISHPQLSVCLPAIEKLGLSKDPNAVAPLAQAVADEQRPLVRRYLVDALGHLGYAEGRPTLIAALRDPDVQVRISAIAALSIVGGKESEAALRSHVDAETDSDVKAHLIFHLGMTHSAEDLKELQRLKVDADPRIRRMADEELKTHVANGKN